MAGEGQRYVDAGYQIPKPFIEVDGLPMVIRACQALPKADRYIFVCRKSHLEKYPMEEKIKEYIPNAIIVTVDKLTEGQAITCLAARDYIPDDAILIGVDELTAIVKRSGETHWVVVGEAKVHVLKGLPDQQLHDGEQIHLSITK
jgi:choline kinase